MTNMLRKALLGGAALAVMTTGAAADELSTLKAQLEALQGRVNSLESAPAAALPEGTSLMTFRRGAADYDFKAARGYNALEAQDDGGYTIGITPTADLPAPVAEITVSGYVTSWLCYDFDGNTPDDNCAFNPAEWDYTDGDDHIGIDSRGSVRVRSRIDTAVGQIRTDIELRADAPGGADMRYAWGEWDMTPNWTLGAGSFFQLASLISTPSTLNGSGVVGPTATRVDQIRLTYTDGPLSWAVALEEPTFDSSTNMPDIVTSITYDVAGGHQFQVIAGVSDWEPVGNDELGWIVGGGASVNLGDVATLTLGAVYGEGLVRQHLYNISNGLNGGGAVNVDLCRQSG